MSAEHGSSREIFELRSAVGTQFARVFDFPYFGLDKLKHTIEPLLEYLYIPPVDQGDLPVFDGIDRINERSLFTYGFATRLLGRERADEGRRARRGVRAGASVGDAELRLPSHQSRPRRRSSRDRPAGQPGQGDHFSDIDFALRVNPGP